MQRVSSAVDLYETNSSYIFRKVYPVHLRATLGQELKRSIGKKKDVSLKEAQRRAVDMHRVYERTVKSQDRITQKNQHSPSLLPSSDSELEQMARQFFGDTRDKKARARRETTGAVPDATPADIQERRELAQLLRRMHSNGNFAPFQGYVDLFLTKENLIVGMGSRDWQRLVSFLGLAFIENIERDIDLQDMKPEQTHDPIFEPIQVDEAQRQGRKASVVVAQLTKEYMADPIHQRRWSPKTQLKHKVFIDFFTQFFGANAVVSSIDRQACRNFQNILLSYPTNAKKLYPNHSIRERIALAEDNGKATMSVTTVNDYMSKLSTLLRWGIRESVIYLPEGNPAEGLQLPDNRRARELRDPFTLNELKKIFGTAKEFGGEIRDVNPEPVEEGDREWKFWLSLLALFTGARANEIAQLDVADVITGGEVDYIEITDEPEGSDKRLKTKNSRRIIPVHPELVKIGFLSYANKMKAKGEIKLFPKLKPGAGGYRSAAVTRWFSRYLKIRKAKTPKNSFHSFRHNMSEALDQAEVRSSNHKELMGWERTGMIGRYGGARLAKELYEDIAKVQYEGLDLSHLYADQD